MGFNALLQSLNVNDVDLIHQMFGPPRHHPNPKTLDLTVSPCVVRLERVALLECIRRKLIENPQQFVPAASRQGNKKSKHRVVHGVIIDQAHRP